MMISNRIIEIAKRTALQSQGVGGRHKEAYKLGAVLLRKGRVVNAKPNSYKTHPILSLSTSYPHLHAETNVVISHGLDHCSGLDLLVVRVLKNGGMSMAKPCPICQRILTKAKLNTIYYSNWEGKIEEFNLANPSNL